MFLQWKDSRLIVGGISHTLASSHQQKRATKDQCSYPPTWKQLVESLPIYVDGKLSSLKLSWCTDALPQACCIGCYPAVIIISPEGDDYSSAHLFLLTWLFSLIVLRHYITNSIGDAIKKFSISFPKFQGYIALTSNQSMTQPTRGVSLPGFPLAIPGSSTSAADRH